MLGYLTNDFMKTNLNIHNTGQIIFVQKMKELLYSNSGVAYSYKIHNAYSILQELKSVIDDYKNGRINGYIVEEVRKEAVELVKKDLVIRKVKKEVYETIQLEIKKGFSIDKANQEIKADDMSKVNSVYNTISNITKLYTIEDYLRDSLNELKKSIDDNDGDRILELCECLVSTIIMTKRTVKSLYRMCEYYFEKSTEKSFDDRWRQWASKLLLFDEKYRCYFEIEKNTAEKVENKISGERLNALYENKDGTVAINEESYYFYCDIQSPADDLYYLLEHSYSKFIVEMGIVEFTTANVKELTKTVIVYDEFFKSLKSFDISRFQSRNDYKPYNQYHKNIDWAVKAFIDSVSTPIEKNKVENAIINSCNFEKRDDAYDFLLLWSSLESLFRSTQYANAISAIKEIVPNILSSRYIYYRIFDFLNDCEKVNISYEHQGQEVVSGNYGRRQVRLMFSLLRDETEVEGFLQICKDKYELLYYKGKELHDILLNKNSIRQKLERHKVVIAYQLQRMYRIRNKFVHHSMIDDNMEVLCKHIRVYMWESIREMSYIAKKRKINTLEELYSYFKLNYIAMQRSLNEELDVEHLIDGYL